MKQGVHFIFSFWHNYISYFTSEVENHLTIKHCDKTKVITIMVKIKSVETLKNSKKWRHFDVYSMPFSSQNE